MIAVVGEQQSAVLDEAAEAVALPRGEAHEFVAGNEQERKGQQLLGGARSRHPGHSSRPKLYNGACKRLKA